VKTLRNIAIAAAVVTAIVVPLMQALATHAENQRLAEAKIERACNELTRFAKKGPIPDDMLDDVRAGLKQCLDHDMQKLGVR
jgi:hypothetical protein